MKQPKQQPRFRFYDDYEENAYWLHLNDLPKLIKLFKMVHTRIANGKEQFICHALYSGFIKLRSDYMTRTIAGKYVMASLHKGNIHVASFDSWLIYAENGRAIGQGRQARMLWLNQNIARFEEILKENK